MEIKDFIEKLENGFSTKLHKDINEAVVDLLGGEKQNIAIGRMLYIGGDLVILVKLQQHLILWQKQIFMKISTRLRKTKQQYTSHIG